VVEKDRAVKQPVMYNLIRTLMAVVGVYIIGNEIDQYKWWAVLAGALFIYIAFAFRPEDMSKKREGRD